MKLEFLDLTDIDESELNHLQQVLNTVNPSVKLPWEVHTEFLCPAEYGPYAVPPLGLRGVFLPQPLYPAAPAAVQVGLVPASDTPNGPSQVGLVQSLDGGMESHHLTTESVYPDNVPVMSVPQPVSMPPPALPVMTNMYPMPMSNVYVSSMTANVNVQSYVGTHLTSYPQQPAVYRTESHEMSPNATRGNSNSRRGRGGKINKRMDGNQYVNSRNSHVHEVMSPAAVMESPPTSAPPLQPPNYALYPMPLPYQQTYYTSAGQPPHAGHITHPSAQHAAGPPLYLQSIYSHHPQPIYGTFPPHHQAPTGGTILYSSTPIPATTVPSTEPSVYQVEEVTEEKEILDLNDVENTFQSDVVQEEVHLSDSHDLKPPMHSPQDSETEVINNINTNSDSVVEQAYQEPVSASNSELIDIVPPDSSSQLPVSEPENSPNVATTTIKQAAPGVPSSPFPLPSQKNSPFPRQPSTPNELSPSTAASSTLDKSWASLFSKSGGSSSPFDAARITTGQKPVATVPPFPNSTGDVVRKESAALPISVSEASKGFPPLSHGQVGQVPTSAVVDDPNLYRLGEFLSKYQLEHKAISLQPRGLTNRSNWCYINSTLQALLACPPFYNLMKSLPLVSRRSGKSSTPIIDSMYQFVNEFVPLSATSRVNRKEKAQRKDENFEVQAGAAFEPSYIYKMLSNIQSDTFKVEGRQEDAEEFLSCLLNAINDEMLELIKLVEDPASSKTILSNGDITNGDAANQSQDEDEDEDGWKVMGPKNKGSITRRADFGRTPVSDIFRGELRSRVHRAGDESTDSVQPFFTLQLDIEKAQSVKDALELLVGRDQLEGVTCSKTNQEVEAWQQVTLQELPLVLILHLKWFDYKLDGCSKIVKTVEFPIDLIVDAKLMSSTKNYNRNQKKYKLFAVVYHDGKEATKGHYVTDVYHVGYGGWVRYDDSVVKPVQEASMLRPRGARVPYLLYYRRLDTIGSGGAVTPDKSR